MERIWKPFIPALLAVLAALAGQHFVYTLKNPFPAFILFGAAAVLLAASVGLKNMKEQYRPAPKRADKPLKPEALVFLIIIAAAGYFRLGDINSMPYGCHRDEAKAVLDSYDIMTGVKPLEADSALPVYIRSITDNPAMYNYVLTGFFRVFGPGITEARVASALTGILAVASLYFLLRYLLGVYAAMAGGFLFAFMHWHSIFSRIIYHSGFSVLFIVLTLYFAYRSYFSGRWSDFAFFGLALALGLNTYHATRALPLGIAFCGLYIAAVDPVFYRKNLLKILAAILVFGAAFMPLGAYIAKHYGDFMARPREMFVLSEKQMKARGTGESRLQVYTSNMKKALLMYNMQGDQNITYNVNNLPMAGYFTGALAAAGFFYALLLAAAGSKAAALTIILFLTYIHGTVLFIETPHAARAVLTIPFPAIFAAFFIKAFFFASAGSRFTKSAAAAVAACLIILSAFHGHRVLFHTWAKSPHIWAGFDTEVRSAAEHYKTLGPGWKGIFPEGYIHDYLRAFSFKAAMLGAKSHDPVSFQIWNNMPFVPAGESGAAYYFPANRASMLALLREVYPEGRYVPFYRHNNPAVLSHFAYLADRRALESARPVPEDKGLFAKYYSGSDFSGTPAIVRTDPVLDFFWYRPEVPPFLSAEWSGRLIVDRPGEYYFYLYSRDGSDMAINGAVVIDNMNGARKWRGEGRAVLERGEHKINIRYRLGGDRRISLWWNGPGTGGEVPVPYGAVVPQ